MNVNTKEIIYSPFYSFWNFRLLAVLPPGTAAGRVPPPGVQHQAAPRPLSIAFRARDSTAKSAKNNPIERAPRPCQ